MTKLVRDKHDAPHWGGLTDPDTVASGREAARDQPTAHTAEATSEQDRPASVRVDTPAITVSPSGGGGQPLQEEAA